MIYKIHIEWNTTLTIESEGTVKVEILDKQSEIKIENYKKEIYSNDISSQVNSNSWPDFL